MNDVAGCGRTSRGGSVSGSTSSEWRLISGPGTVVFANPSSATSSVTFDQTGAYLLELAAIQAHEAGLITSCQVQEMLGLADREELFAFFKANNARDHSFTMEELERERATMAALLRWGLMNSPRPHNSVHVPLPSSDNG